MIENQKRNLTILFFSQGVLGAQIPVNFILGGLAGALLAENRALATLPISIIVLVAMFVAPGASLFMGRFGRRLGFLLGDHRPCRDVRRSGRIVVHAASGGAWWFAGRSLALFEARFDLLLMGAACTGVFQAFQVFFRFAAADAASEEFKPKAISLVLGAGLINAILAGEVVRQLGDALDPVPYAGAYAGVIVLNFIGACIVMFLRIPRPPRQTETGGTARPLGVIFRQPRVITAVLCAMVSYAVMNLVMTSTPLALVGNGFTTNQAADVVRWHVVAMFAPSFVTGHIIARVGHLPVAMFASSPGTSLRDCCWYGIAAAASARRSR